LGNIRQLGEAKMNDYPCGNTQAELNHDDCPERDDIEYMERYEWALNELNAGRKIDIDGYYEPMDMTMLINDYAASGETHLNQLIDNDINIWEKFKSTELDPIAMWTVTKIMREVAGVYAE